MSASWSYDGAATLSVTIDDAVIGDKYRLSADDPGSTAVTATASGTSLTVTLTDVSGTAGLPFAVFLYHGDSVSVSAASEGIYDNIFTIGTADTLGTVYEAVWSYDGVKTVSVTFTAEAGITYHLRLRDGTTFDTTGGPYTAGSTQTLSVTMTGPGPATRWFWGALYDDNPPFPEYTDRVFQGGSASAGVSGNPSVAPSPPVARRFFRGFPWRYVVTDLDSATLTFLDRLARDRTVTVAVNQPRDMSGSVPSDSPEVNIPHTDGDPFLAEGNRLLYVFRREGGTGAPWVIQGAGPIDHVEDAALTGSPVTHFSARDPWQLLYRCPVRDGSGDRPTSPAGLVFAGAQQVGDIAYQLLINSIAAGEARHIDPLGSSVPATDTVTDFTLDPSKSVGQAWDDLCATGLLDIELAPVYDPLGRPGICVEFIVHSKLGTVQNDAIFAWDKPSRSLTGISRVTDGTQRENTIQYFAGQGGPAVALASDAASIDKYGPYWAQQFWPGRAAGPVAAMADQRLMLFKDGAKSYTFQPAPERSPVPLRDYWPGDWAPFYASKRLRTQLAPTIVGGAFTDIPRVRAITLDIADNQTETVSELLVAMETPPIPSGPLAVIISGAPTEGETLSAVIG